MDHPNTYMQRHKYPEMFVLIMQVFSVLGAPDKIELNYWNGNDLITVNNRLVPVVNFGNDAKIIDPIKSA